MKSANKFWQLVKGFNPRKEIKIYRNDAEICIRIESIGPYSTSSWNGAQYIWLSPKEAVDMATKIINHAYPFTRSKRNPKTTSPFPPGDFHAGWLREEVKKAVEIRDPGPKINQGCHRP